MSNRTEYSIALDSVEDNDDFQILGEDLARIFTEAFKASGKLTKVIDDLEEVADAGWYLGPFRTALISLREMMAGMDRWNPDAGGIVDGFEAVLDYQDCIEKVWEDDPPSETFYPNVYFKAGPALNLFLDFVEDDWEPLIDAVADHFE